ncbi:formylglycine-generating enzyme family protein [Lichenifustis flavocetrariae]|uniref:Formylglycine-generating enzyme family protein n=1 Tax=Lichenifustis flavocetrariae TaxID=2949735 RepID=A0AA41Z3I4_9HYPH|nr:SUMF1/EgtB/PvdO family nonheme iron enzyme [Lichenifustis flavocetrariae]MCW6509833.1 formylglycine-generating enzyme family protein [Lichenifustis flavocetrariae]
MNVSNWTEHNLLNRFSHLSTNRVSILVAELRNRALAFCGARSTSTVFDLVFRGLDADPCQILFLFASEKEDREWAVRKISEARDVFAVVASPKHFVPLFLAACEISKWWDIASNVESVIRYSSYIRRVEHLLLQVRDETHPTEFDIYSRVARDFVCWNGGREFVAGVDTKNLRPETRKEQFDDALKRLLDSSFANRSAHDSPGHRLISSQALFWLVELPAERLDSHWLRFTRLYHEMRLAHPNASRIKASMNLLDVHDDSYRAFMACFINVPAGQYLIGSTIQSTLSEPPAQRISVHLEAFQIMLRPVSSGDLCTLGIDPDRCSLPNELPATEINAVEAFQIADALTRKLRSIGIISDVERVILPNEFQWEAAARGPSGSEYPWGDVFYEDCCNCEQNFGLCVTPLGQFSPRGDSPYGCQDMAGNVREWTRSYAGIHNVDWQTYEHEPVERDTSSLYQDDRLIIRGGSYSYDRECVRTWVRNTQIASRRDAQTGFRFVIEKM